MPGVLTGIRVLDLSRLLPGPYCSMVLADHGAEVVAVEDRRFLADGLFFQDLYRNKRHLSLNLKHPDGLKIFWQLAANSDVILEGFRPGVVERLGVDYATVHQRHPGIIYCSITGYGQSGRYRDRVGHDVNYLSVAGVLDLIGETDRPPSIPGVQIADIAGGMNAVQGILLALLERQRSGEGQYIDISMTDSLLGFLTLPALLSQQHGQSFSRSQHLLSHRYACYCTYQTSDHRFLSLGGLEPRFWQNLCQGLGLPEYIPLQYDEGRREEIIARFRTLFQSQPLAHWDELLTRLEVCHAAVATLEEVLQSPYFAEREMLYHHPLADGRTSVSFASAVKLSRSPASLRRRPAAFGEHNQEVLTELGYSEVAIDELIASGAV